MFLIKFHFNSFFKLESKDLIYAVKVRFLTGRGLNIEFVFGKLNLFRFGDLILSSGFRYKREVFSWWTSGKSEIYVPLSLVLSFNNVLVKMCLSLMLWILNLNQTVPKYPL